MAKAGRPIGGASFGRLIKVLIGAGGGGLLFEVADTIARFSVGLSKSDSIGAFVVVVVVVEASVVVDDDNVDADSVVVVEVLIPSCSTC